MEGQRKELWRAPCGCHELETVELDDTGRLGGRVEYRPCPLGARIEAAVQRAWERYCRGYAWRAGHDARLYEQWTRFRNAHTGYRYAGPEFEEGFVDDIRERENFYWEHIRDESYADPHPDGCFYCGSYAHTSDCCTESEEITEFWRGAK